MEEYETDSDDSDNDVDIESEELFICKPIRQGLEDKSRSGQGLMFTTREQNGEPGHANLVIKAS